MQTNTIKPVSSNERLIQLDVLRGVCLCGILFANLMSFTGFYSLDFNAMQQLPAEDRVTLFTIDWLIEGKFYAMFSILFGIGFALQKHRFLNTEYINVEKMFASFWLRRMSVLLFFGLLHILFVWHGDILTLYSLLGFSLLYFSQLSQVQLLRWICFLFLMPVFIHIILYLYYYFTCYIY